MNNQILDIIFVVIVLALLFFIARVIDQAIKGLKKQFGPHERTIYMEHDPLTEPSAFVEPEQEPVRRKSHFVRNFLIVVCIVGGFLLLTQVHLPAQQEGATCTPQTVPLYNIDKVDLLCPSGAIEFRNGTNQLITPVCTTSSGAVVAPVRKQLYQAEVVNGQLQVTKLDNNPC